MLACFGSSRFVWEITGLVISRCRLYYMKLSKVQVWLRSRSALIDRYFATADTCKFMATCGWASTESSPLVCHFSSWPPNQTNGVRPGRVSAGLSGDPVESSQLIVCLLCVNLPATPRPAPPCGGRWLGPRSPLSFLAEPSARPFVTPFEVSHIGRTLHGLSERPQCTSVVHTTF